MLRVGSIVIRVDDLEREAGFWAEALGYERGIDRPNDFILLRPSSGAGPNVSLDRVDAKLQIPPRIHLDLYADDRAAEVRRLERIGAEVIHWDKQPPDSDYTIMADPEGNRFCVVGTG